MSKKCAFCGYTFETVEDREDHETFSAENAILRFPFDGLPLCAPQEEDDE